MTASLTDTILSEQITERPLVEGDIINAPECRKVIGRIFCEMPPSRCPTPPHHPFQAAETFTPDKWEHTLFEGDDRPIGNDGELVREIERGLKAEDLPRTGRGITDLLSIWIFS